LDNLPNVYIELDSGGGPRAKLYIPIYCHTLSTDKDAVIAIIEETKSDGYGESGSR
jgi:hypothetical protein